MDEKRTEQRALPQVEGPRVLAVEQLVQGLLRGSRCIREVCHLHRELGSRMDDLHAFAVDIVECCPQGFMASHKALQRTCQRREVQRSGQAQRQGAVVATCPWLKLVEEPQALLGKRQRQRSGAVRRADPVGLSGMPGQPAAKLLLESGGKCGDASLL